MIYYIRKYCYEGTDIEYIKPEDIFEYGKEEDDKLQHLYMFINVVAKEFNYYNNNTSTAFGNPDLEFYRGQIRGFMMAKQWEWEEKRQGNNTIVYIKTRTGKTIMKIDKPNLPHGEIMRRREIAKERDFFGL